MSPYRVPGDPGDDRDPDYIDDETRFIEERIMGSAENIFAARRRLGRRVVVSARSFAEIAKRLGAKIEEGPHGLFVTLRTVVGRMWLVPSADIKDGRYAFEHRSEDL